MSALPERDLKEITSLREREVRGISFLFSPERDNKGTSDST